MRERNNPLAYVAAAGTLMIAASYAGMISIPWFPPNLLLAVIAAALGLLGALVTWGNGDPARRNTAFRVRMDGWLSLILAGCFAIVAGQLAGYLPPMFGGTSMPVAYLALAAAGFWLVRALRSFSAAKGL